MDIQDDQDLVENKKNILYILFIQVNKYYNNNGDLSVHSCPLALFVVHFLGL